MLQAVGRRTLPPQAWAWALFEGTRNPYVVLIGIYVFAPYFATVLAGDPVRGQTLLAQYSLLSGLLIALTAPLLGTVVDRLGWRVRLLFLIYAAMIPAIAALWFARPDGSGLSVTQTGALLVCANLLFATNELLHNSLIGQVAPADRIGRVSGLGLALGAAISLAMLGGMLLFFLLPGQVAGAPSVLLFGLDATAHEPERAAGPIVALVMAFGGLPLFLTVRDPVRAPQSFLAAAMSGVRGLAGLFAGLRHNRQAALFLGGRTIYADATTAFLLFFGVYAAGVMGWGPTQLLILGIVLSVFAIFGGLLAGVLDAWMSAKRAIQLQLTGIALCTVALLGSGRDRLLFMSLGANRAGEQEALFSTVPEFAFLAIACTSAVLVTGSYASSRTMLTRICPPGQEASYFGLYALSGAATAWLGPLLIELCTRSFHSQQAGFAPIAGLLLIGLSILSFAKADR